MMALQKESTGTASNTVFVTITETVERGCKKSRLTISSKDGEIMHDDGKGRGNMEWFDPTYVNHTPWEYVVPKRSLILASIISPCDRDAVGKVRLVKFNSEGAMYSFCGV